MVSTFNADPPPTRQRPMRAVGCLFLVENGGSATTNPIGIGHAVQSNHMHMQGGERTKSPLSLDHLLIDLRSSSTVDADTAPIGTGFLIEEQSLLALGLIVLQSTWTPSRFRRGIAENTS
ncbi:hypothetical protein PGT21_019089 [Puccinia graminis f. sp. tritici]|uniref:Uncharacterized protein n=1 Tax=Puccinia graminis f. sp. tritici TaxID=56615 RepID=A0A5B0QWM6_PUCGR|nr:hypothetical protein PGT21_019089 [Puccinia graminis f. sp. tritici]